MAMAKQWTVVGLLAIVSVGVAAAQRPLPPPAELGAADVAVHQQDYREALRLLKASKAGHAEKLVWLRKHAEAGNIPMQYELSALLFPTNREEALKWYARGRLGRTLDVAECATNSASFAARVGFDESSAAIRDYGVANPKAFQVAIADALAWNDRRTSAPSSTWICGKKTAPREAETLLPEKERIAARADALRNMRIAAQSVVDFERAVAAGEAANFVVMDSGVVTKGTIDKWAAWLDNDRLLFQGYTGASPAGKNSNPSWNQTVFLWDIAQNRLELVTTARSVTGICVDGSNVLIETQERTSDGVDTEWVHQGTWPTLSKRLKHPLEQLTSSRRSDCKPYQSKPTQWSNAEITWLREGHGFIANTSSRAGMESVLVRGDGSKVRLPTDPHGSSVLQFAPWRDTYLLQGGVREPGSPLLRSPSGRRRGDESVLFWLFPDGRSTEIVIPFGLWDFYGNNVSPAYRATRVGLVLAGGRSESEHAEGYAGFYFFPTDGPVIRLIGGQVWMGAVSPDGCKVGFWQSPNAAAREVKGSTAKVIDLCKGIR